MVAMETVSTGTKICGVQLGLHHTTSIPKECLIYARAVTITFYIFLKTAPTSGANRLDSTVSCNIIYFDI